MVTKHDRSLRREVQIQREPWGVTISSVGLELQWEALSSGDAALAAALNASLAPVRNKRGPRDLVKG